MPGNLTLSELRALLARRASTSVLETLDVDTGEGTVLKVFDAVIEAPNWTRDGRRLIFNSQGFMHAHDLASGEVTRIDTGFAVDCNNDHVLSPDDTELAISHFAHEDVESRIDIVPIGGGEPRLVTERGPSYLHGWSPDGRRVVYVAYGRDDVAPGEHPPDRQVEIRLASTEGGESRVIAQLFGGQGTMNVNSWSPDGRRIAFVSYRT